MPPFGSGWLPVGPFTPSPDPNSNDNQFAADAKRTVVRAMADARLIKVSRDLLPELIALWEAAERHGEGAAGLAEALATLNAKAGAIFAKASYSCPISAPIWPKH